MISCGWREGISEASGGGEQGHLMELLESSVPVAGYLPFHADLLLLLLLCVHAVFFIRDVGFCQLVPSLKF